MHHDKRFEDEDFSETRPFEDELSQCVFVGCTFVESDLSNLLLVDCVFERCDLSMVNLANTRLQDVRFEDSRLLGVDFSACSDFGLRLGFSGCTLEFAGFSAMGLSGTRFVGCSLKGADFTESDLSKVVLSMCDLSEAVFASTNLQRADLRGSTGLAIDPTRNRITNAKISLASLPGLLLEHRLKIE